MRTSRFEVIPILLALHSGMVAAQAVPEKAGDNLDQSGATVVIVTGTRASGLSVKDSASPVQVFDSITLGRTGQSELIQALAQILPSFTAQTIGGDQANFTLSGRLRGLNPNNTLVLINGKRRHTTANLNVPNGPFQGAAAADLSFIPVAAIDRIEVLQDGAAAQYGTDAIAGVINIILKSNKHGGSINANGGSYADGGGSTADAWANFGVSPFDGAFLDLTAEAKHHGFSDRGGIDPRVISSANVTANPTMLNAPGYPYLNHISGDAEYHLSTFLANFGYEFRNGMSLYSVVTVGSKSGRSYENYRLPSRLPKVYPLGFSPLEAVSEDDYAITFGIRGKWPSDWRWDISTTYGDNIFKPGVINSGNVSLYGDTGTTPTEFNAGQFRASQLTNNLDLTREFEIGWSTPLTVAFGAEQRSEAYDIAAGDAASRYKEGSQSFPGFSLTDAGNHRRTNYAGYLEFAGNPTKKLMLDLAGRFEHFSDFGNATVGKATGRYDVSAGVALRGTLSTGFRAPTLAEEFYSATNVSPSAAFVQLAPNSAGAKLVGVDGLKPEKSTNFSVGLILNPTARMTTTLDFYQISVKNRVVGSGSLYGSGGAVNSPAVVAAILANGNILDSAASQTGISLFSNAVDTRNRGVEFVLTAGSDFNSLGKVDWTAAFNYNRVEVTNINQAPAVLRPQALLDQAAISDIESASPRYRLILTGSGKRGPWGLNVVETVYGPSSEYGTQDGGQYFNTNVGTKAITDIDLNYHFSKSFSIAVGAHNLFNQYPEMINETLLAQRRARNDSQAVLIYPWFSPYGINGRYAYVKAEYRF